MPNLTNIPRQSLFQTTLQSPINAVQTSGIILSDVIDFTPSGVFYLSVLDPSNPEVISCTGQNSSGELTGVTRGLELADGVVGVATAHGAGVTIVLSDPFQVYEDIQTAVNSKIDETGGTLTGLLDFSGSGRIQVPVFADDTARDTAIPSPANGLLVYNTADGEFQVYQSGAWASVASGSTQPNASEIVAGKVELATQSEANAGTAIGGTGASLVVTPDKLAELIQESKYIYKETTGTSSNYILTLDVPISGYIEGQRFYFKANHTNTGVTTININGVGVANIKKNSNQELVAGNIQQNDIYIIAYNGTYFELLNPNDIVILPQGQIWVGDVNNDPIPVNLKTEQILHLSYPLTTLTANATTNVLSLPIDTSLLVDNNTSLMIDIITRGGRTSSGGDGGNLEARISANATELIRYVTGATGSLSGDTTLYSGGRSLSELILFNSKQNVRCYSLGGASALFAANSTGGGLPQAYNDQEKAFDFTANWTLNVDIANLALQNATLRKIEVKLIKYI